MLRTRFLLLAVMLTVAAIPALAQDARLDAKRECSAGRRRDGQAGAGDGGLPFPLRRAGCCALRRIPRAIHLNKTILDKYREEMKKYYYDSTMYKTYLDRLGSQVPDGGTTPQ